LKGFKGVGFAYGEADVLMFAGYAEEGIDVWDEGRAVVHDEFGAEEEGLDGGEVHDPA